MWLIFIMVEVIRVRDNTLTFIYYIELKEPMKKSTD